MRESFTYGSVRGAARKGGSYRDLAEVVQTETSQTNSGYSLFFLKSRSVNRARRFSGGAGCRADARSITRRLPINLRPPQSPLQCTTFLAQQRRSATLTQ